MNGLLKNAIYAKISFIINGLFTAALNFIQITSVSFTPSVPCCCIAKPCGLIRAEVDGMVPVKHTDPTKGVVPMKNNFEKKLAEASVAYTYHIGEEI